MARCLRRRARLEYAHRPNALSAHYSSPIARLRPARSPAAARPSSRRFRRRRHALARHLVEHALCQGRVGANGA